MARPEIETIGGIRSGANTSDGQRGNPNGAPVISELTIPLRAFTTLDSIATGFRIEWGTIDDAPKGPLVIDVGAGFGSPWMTIDYDGKIYGIKANDIAAALLEMVEQSDG